MTNADEIAEIAKNYNMTLEQALSARHCCNRRLYMVTEDYVRNEEYASLVQRRSECSGFVEEI